MKRTIPLLCTALLASPLLASAFTLPAGTQEVGAGGFVDFRSPEGARVHADLAYGLYLLDHFQINLQADIRRGNQETIYAFGAGAEVAYDIGLTLYPYLGARIMVASYDTLDQGGGAGIIGGKAGALIFLTEQIACFGELRTDWATSRIYADKRRPRPADAGIRFGFRLFFY